MAEIRFRLNGEKTSFDLDKLMFVEVREIERVTGEPFKQVMENLKSGWIGPMQAIVWIAFRRSNPGVKYGDYDNVPISDVEILDDNDEKITPPADGEDGVDAGPFDGPDDTNL